jgi:hypothetical protein
MTRTTTTATICCALILVGASSKAAPSPTEQTAVIKAIREYALSYTKSLSDYTGTLTIHHTTRPPNAVNDPSIQTAVIDEQLTFVDGREIADPPLEILPRQALDLLRIIFEPETTADLRWSRAASLNGHKVDVLSFRVPQSNGYIVSESGRGMLVPFEGSVYADVQTHAVLRIQMKCTMVPDSSPYHNVDLTLDYKAAQLGGRELILPSHLLLNYIHNSEDRQVIDDGRYAGWRPAGSDKR